MKIYSKTDFIQYIRIRLGHPIVNIELTDNQIELIIDDIINIKWFTGYECELHIDHKDECVKRAYELLLRIRGNL